MNAELATAYGASGPAWQAGPGRIYEHLAEVLVDRSPVPLTGARVLDLGAGTGAASRAARRRGADVVALDAALGMLRFDAGARPPAAVGDAMALPCPARSFDVVVAAFSMNHLIDPVAGLHEARRVLRAGGGMVVATYASDDGHPVKAATEEAAAARGWSDPAWYRALRDRAVPRLATVERAASVAASSGLAGVNVEHLRVPFPELRPADLVAWRLGMAQMAPFVARLPPAERAALAADALGRLGPDPPVLVRSIIVLTFRDGG